MADEISRREFVKQTAVGTAALAGASAGALEAVAAAGPTNPNRQIVAALGPLFIPSKPGDPGYAELESYGISDYVMKPIVTREVRSENCGNPSCPFDKQRCCSCGKRSGFPDRWTRYV